jgi:hypothetical protein
LAGLRKKKGETGECAAGECEAGRAVTELLSY